MNMICHNDIAQILDSQASPCLSLYLPTHRSHPDRQQDTIRFRNLVKSLEESLRKGYASRDAEALLKPFWELADDSRFWHFTGDSLAVFGSPDLFYVHRLQRPLSELAVVADTFHIKPILRILQSADRYHVLGLSRDNVSLYEGNRDALVEIELPADVMQIIADAHVDRRKERHVETWNSNVGSSAVAVRGGRASGVIEHDTQRFFRAVDRIVDERYSRASGLPLLVAALPEHHTPFRRISRNSMLLPQGIEVNPESLSIQDLRDRAWHAIAPHYLARLAGLMETFSIARAQGLGDDDLRKVMKAATAGRIATLLIEADRQIPGRVDANGEIEFGDLAQPDVDDLLDDLAELTMRNSGQVVVVPAGRMPTNSGLAAIYRF